MCYKIGSEIVGWEIFGKLIYGCKFFTIDDISENYIYAHYTDWRGTHTHKFSKKTGKEWRKKPWEPYFHITKQGVKRK